MLLQCHCPHPKCFLHPHCHHIIACCNCCKECICKNYNSHQSSLVNNSQNISEKYQTNASCELNSKFKYNPNSNFSQSQTVTQFCTPEISKIYPRTNSYYNINNNIIDENSINNEIYPLNCCNHIYETNYNYNNNNLNKCLARNNSVDCYNNNYKCNNLKKFSYSNFLDKTKYLLNKIKCISNAIGNEKYLGHLKKRRKIKYLDENENFLQRMRKKNENEKKLINLRIKQLSDINNGNDIYRRYNNSVIEMKRSSYDVHQNQKNQFYLDNNINKIKKEEMNKKYNIDFNDDNNSEIEYSYSVFPPKFNGKKKNLENKNIYNLKKNMFLGNKNNIRNNGINKNRRSIDIKNKKEDIYYEHIINNGNNKYQNYNINNKNDKNINAKRNTRKSYQSVAIYNYKKKYNINKNNNDENKINQVNIMEKDSNRNYRKNRKNKCIEVENNNGNIISKKTKNKEKNIIRNKYKYEFSNAGEYDDKYENDKKGYYYIKYNRHSSKYKYTNRNLNDKYNNNFYMEIFCTNKSKDKLNNSFEIKKHHISSIDNEDNNHNKGRRNFSDDNRYLTPDKCAGYEKNLNNLQEKNNIQTKINNGNINTTYQYINKDNIEENYIKENNMSKNNKYKNYDYNTNNNYNVNYTKYTKNLITTNNNKYNNLNLNNCDFLDNNKNEYISGNLNDKQRIKKRINKIDDNRYNIKNNIKIMNRKVEQNDYNYNFNYN